MTTPSAVCNSQWTGRPASICWVGQPPSLKEITNQSSRGKETLRFPSRRIFFLPFFFFFSFFFFKGNFMVSNCRCPSTSQGLNSSRDGYTRESRPWIPWNLGREGRRRSRFGYKSLPRTQHTKRTVGSRVHSCMCHELLQDFALKIKCKGEN